jgi:hypothetical protein
MDFVFFWQIFFKKILFIKKNLFLSIFFFIHFHKIDFLFTIERI